MLGRGGVMYHHRQVGWVLYGIAFAVVVAILAIGTPETRPIGAMLVPLFAVVGLLFGWLTVEVDRQEVRVRFGIGLIRRTVATTAIRSVAPVRNAWISGWGLRKIRGGWLWNVSGLDAVELVLQDGAVLRIGTDEPEALAVAIQRVVGAGPTGGRAR